MKQVAETKIKGGIYALVFNPDGQCVAAAGEDGHVRLISTTDGKITKEFVPVPVSAVKFTSDEPAKPSRR